MTEQEFYECLADDIFADPDICLQMRSVCMAPFFNDVYARLLALETFAAGLASLECC